MQVISRRANEGVVVGNDIFITVLEVREDHIRVAISSQRGLPSYWEETLYVTAGQDDAELAEAELELSTRA